jgi:exopolysaccharide biosynthesis polyprenyl glycosylphosphotransferase
VAAFDQAQPALLADLTGAPILSPFRMPTATCLLSVALDLLCGLLAAILALPARIWLVTGLGVSPPGHPPVGLVVAHVLWFWLCLVLSLRGFGLYRPLEQITGLDELRRTTHAVLVAGLTLCGTLYLSSGLFLSRLQVLLTIFFTLLLLVGRRSLHRHLLYQRHRAGIETRNVLIVGAGRVAQALRAHILGLEHLGLRFTGFASASDNPSASHDLLAHARSLFVDEILLAGPTDSAFLHDLVHRASRHAIDIRVVPDLYDGLAWNAPVEFFGQFPTIPLYRRDLPLGATLVKRGLDICLASIALFLLAPMLFIIGLSIRMDSRGPILYVSKRIGRKGRTFDCYKLRTMIPEADGLKAALAHRNERDGILFKIANDPRVTRLGQFLRKYSLDELPQLYNVIRGDMSLVGPRPPVADEVQHYTLRHLRRLDVLPGLTGLWQVEARQDPSFDSYISLDTAYVENWSLLLDVKILLRTVMVVLAGTGS